MASMSETAGSSSEQPGQPIGDLRAALRRATHEAVREHSTLFLIQGILMMVIGAFAVIAPMVAGLAVVLLVGWVLIISGITQAISVVAARKAPNFWWSLISAVLGVIVGILLLVHPVEGKLALTLLLVVFFMIEGVSKVVLALSVRPQPRWGWLMFSGLLSIVLAIIIWAQFPFDAAWVLGLLVGLELLFSGASTAGLALAAKRTAGVE